MLKKLPFLILFVFFSGIAQDKVKGSRNILTEQYDLSTFHSIQAEGEFKIGILKGNRPSIQIEADDNLHDLIQTDVRDGVLYIKPLKEISRAKRMDLRITFSDSLKYLKVAGKVEFISLQDLNTSSLQLETANNARVYLTLVTKALDLRQHDDAKAELNITAQEVNFQLNHSSEVRCLVNAPVFKVDIYEKASARIEGDVEEFLIRADQSSKFDGENLTSIKADLLAQGSAEVKVNAADTLNITARGRSEVEIYNEPKINLIDLKEEASITKKEFSKGLFK